MAISPMPRKATAAGADCAEDPVADKWGECAAQARECHVDAHVGGGFFFGGDFRDPETPEDFSAAHGHALKGHREAENPDIGGEEEEADAEEKEDVEQVASRDEVQAVEEVPPHLCA